MQQPSWFHSAIGRRQAIGAAVFGGAAAGAFMDSASSQAAVGTGLPISTDPVLAAAPVGDPTRDTRSILAAIQIARSSGRTAKLRSGTYAVDSLRVPSGTDLDLGGATIRQTNPSAGSDTGAALRNADFARGNSRISIYNGTITLGPGARGRIVAMVNVKQLTLTGLTIDKGQGAFSDWMLYIRQAQDVIISDCRVTGGTELGEDGIHLEACRRVFVNGCTVEAGDDAFAVVQQYHCPNASSDIFVSDCSLTSRSAYVVRCSVYEGEKHGIHGVRIADCEGGLPTGASGNAMILNDDTGKGRITRVEIAGMTIGSSGSGAGGALVRGVRNSTFSRVRITGVHGRSFDVRGCRTITFQGCSTVGRSGVGGEGWWLEDSTDVGLVGCSSTNSPVAGFAVAGSRTSRVSFTSCRSTGAGSYGFVLFTSANVRLVDCATARSRTGALYDKQIGKADRLIL